MTARKMTQEQMYYKERAQIAALNEAFMWHVNEGMTKGELQALINTRTEVYSRFAHWIDRLPAFKAEGNGIRLI